MSAQGFARRHFGACRGCEARVLWAHTGARLMPVDPLPVDNGNVELSEVGGQLVAKVVAVGPGKFQSHFVTCKQAERFRKKPARKEA